MKTLIDDYLDKQALIAAVEKFSDQHDRNLFEAGQKKYRELLPAKTPEPGQQYAFEVDLDKCTGCKACVTACHNENGLEEDETWRFVGLIQGGNGENPAIQHVTTACHHCVEPACMKGCPTLAYVKDPATGIVKHLDDQCFGCQYCILKCPYDVPKYDKKRGIVHKCDMCMDRLAAGQAPACVRACPNGAIRITLVNKEEVKRNAPAYVMNVPDAPASDYTYPTTKYKTKRNFPANMESTDYYAIKPEHAHFPLVVMLVLTQLSVGAFGAEFLLKTFLDPHFHDAFSPWHVLLALTIGFLALGASLFHLGRPHLAFRAFLGFRTSWLSREIIAFGAFAHLAVVYALLHWVDPLQKFFTQIFFGISPMPILAALVLGSGLLGIFCSVMVYRDTKRPFWDNHLTTAKFFLTAVILGCATVLVTSMAIGLFNPDISFVYIRDHFGQRFAKVIAVGMSLKLFLEAGILLYLDKGNMSFLRKTAILMTGPLKKFTAWRFGCGVIGGMVLPLLLLQFDQGSAAGGAGVALRMFLMTILILGLTLAGEFLERYLFFRAVVPLKMPGGVSASS